MLLNHSIENLAQGVSQQHEEARFETQVAEMVNCIPDISRGIFRRNPVNGISTLSDGVFSNSPNYYTYAYDRGDNEKYIVQINNNNTLQVVQTSDGTIVDTLTSDYLSVPVSSKYPNVYDSFNSLTIGDFTFINNKNVETALKTTTDGTIDSEKRIGIYWVKEITSIDTVIQSQAGASETQQVADVKGYAYTLNGVTVQAERTYTWNGSEYVLATDLLEAEDIAAELASQLGANYYAEGSFVYYQDTAAPSSWSWSDSLSSSVSFGFNGVVNDSADLPAVLPDAIVDYYTTQIGGVYVYVSGGSDDAIGYWLEYEKGVGWKEGRKPGLKNTIDETTMPHVLVRGSDNNFYFKPYNTTDLQTVPGLEDTELGWKERKYGDEETAKAPSFIGSAITEIFFYQNRLGFISTDNIVLSNTNTYGRFFPTSIRASIDSDVIDITIASQEISILRYTIELSDRIIVFADDKQFIISAEGPISPNNVVITVASKYNILPKAKPIVVGDSAFFVSSIGGSERLYRYTLSTQVDNKFIATDVSLHTPSYLNGSTTKLLGHSTIGYTIMLEYGSNTLFIFNGTTIGEEQKQAAIHKWVFPMNIIGGNIIENKLYLSFYDGTNIHLTNLDLNTPVDYSTVVYEDTIGSTSYEFDSKIVFSEWQVKENNFGTVRGRLQIRTIEYNVDDLSKYTTILVNKDLTTTTFNSLIQSGLWDDTLFWSDASPWLDDGYKFSRYYTDDSLITVMGNSKATTITFKQSEDEPTKGFNLKTVNYEGQFYQRSRRY